MQCHERPTFRIFDLLNSQMSMVYQQNTSWLFIWGIFERKYTCFLSTCVWINNMLLNIQNVQNQHRSAKRFRFGRYFQIKWEETLIFHLKILFCPLSESKSVQGCQPLYGNVVYDRFPVWFHHVLWSQPQTSWKHQKVLPKKVRCQCNILSTTLINGVD